MENKASTKSLETASIAEICFRVSQDQDLRLQISDNMRTYGGSFVQALGECLIRADRVNTMKITEAFINYIIEYLPHKWTIKDTSNARIADDTQ